MCGIVGCLEVAAGRTTTAAQWVDRMDRMADPLVHRGPDDRGSWVDADAGIGLAFRRLAIVDLSPSGRQPMASPSGRYVMVFNGEIYNHAELRRKLEQSPGAPTLRGRSDSEVLVTLIEQRGLEAALQECVGMFALAVWDRRERRLQLARHRVGEKPLYYGWCGDALLFASELKALRGFERWDGRVNRDVMPVYTRHGYLPPPYSIYEGILQLQPGTVLTMHAAEASPGQLAEPAAYWSLRPIVDEGATRHTASDAELLTGLEARLRDAVALQMEADVPIGAFLSGGIDSSLVVALMQDAASRPVKTFSIGFHESAYNEADHAKAVAGHLGTEHTELYVTPDEAQAVIPRLPMIYDEPFADSSQIPTYLVSRLASSEVTVCLSGDGGDELFGGYPRYEKTCRLWRWISRLPRPIRGPLAQMLGPRSGGWLGTAAVGIAQWGSTSAGPGALRRRLSRLSDVLRQDHLELFYRSMVSLGPTLTHKDTAADLLTPWNDRSAWAASSDPLHRVAFLDMLTYLPGDILVKVDRAAMATSLETRVPLLDHRVVEWAWQLPASMKARDGQMKWALRQILQKYVPQTLTERPKMGFGVPIGAWLRGPLRPWAEALLSEHELRRDDYFDTAAVRWMWDEHLSGVGNWETPLWAVLSFQGWAENMREQNASTRNAA